MESSVEIIVLPFFGQGHLNPCLELCKQIVCQNMKAIFIIPSTLSSSIPSYTHPFLEVVQLSNPPKPADRPGPGSDPLNESGPRRAHPLAKGVEEFLTERFTGSGRVRPVCAIVDVMMQWSREIFVKLGIPIASFFTSGACNSAMEYAKWKADADSINPGETRVLPGLPENMSFSFADVKRNHRRIGGREAGKPGPDEPGGSPGERRHGPKKTPWWEDVEESMALLFNTCDDLEGVFIQYIGDQIGKPVKGVGPMLPEQYWNSAGSVVRDHEVRSNRKADATEDEVMEWLNSKPKQSVIYISFGSEVSPTSEEFAELADALEEANRAFIWVVPPGSGTSGPPRGMLSLMGRKETQDEGYFPHCLDEKVGNRGMIIKGWAPQLLILSHPSLGAFLSHCGWNSTVEAIGRGVPILAWPIRGDQFHNAKLLVNHLKVGKTLLTSDDPLEMMKKEHILKGIEIVMDDQEIHKRAKQLANKFHPSAASLKEFINLLSK
ncbi:transferase [Lithospermum erythrorhizon]|uniref:Glycosyltransferase n=1 Tax=Lithospermum erythrorhizon TaxID=34254 RepID=A0AAV3PSH8_LITER